jgi:hypothetical protein
MAATVVAGDQAETPPCGAQPQLNGAGVRYKAVFKVYVAALPGEKKANTPEEILALPGKKRVSVTMLRDIDANGKTSSSPRHFRTMHPKSEFSKLIPGLTKPARCFFALKLNFTGDEFSVSTRLVWSTTFWVRGGAATQPGDRAQMLQRRAAVWLGPQPPTGNSGHCSAKPA